MPYGQSKFVYIREKKVEQPDLLPSLVFEVAVAAASCSEVWEDTPGSCSVASLAFSFGLHATSGFFLVTVRTLGVRSGRWIGAGLETVTGGCSFCLKLGEDEGGFCLTKKGVTIRTML